MRHESATSFNAFDFDVSKMNHDAVESSLLMTTRVPPFWILAHAPSCMKPSCNSGRTRSTACLVQQCGKTTLMRATLEEKLENPSKRDELVTIFVTQDVDVAVRDIERPSKEWSTVR